MELKSFFRYLGRNKTYTLINVIGFALSLAFVILTMAYTWQESTMDHFHKDADRIYIAVNKTAEGWWEAGDALPVTYWYKETFPEVEDVCPVVSVKDVAVECRGGQQEAVTLFTEDNFFSFFSFPLVWGSPETVLDDPYKAVLSERFSKQLFGEGNPVGRTLRIADSILVEVGGVMKDMEKTVLPSADLLLRVERARDFNPGLTRESTNNAGGSITCLKAVPGKDMNDYRQKALDMYKRKGYWIFDSNQVFFAHTDVAFLRIDKAYLAKTGQVPSVLDSDTMNEWLFFDHYTLRSGDRMLIRLLWVLVLIVLAFALFNYINLSMAQAQFRFREAACRRLVGASRLSVRCRLMVESFFLTLASFLLALLLAFAFHPYAERLLQEEIDLSVLGSPSGMGLCLFLVGFVSLLSGWIPSGIVASVKPLDVMKGSFRRCSKGRSGAFFVGFQSAVTFILMSLAVVCTVQVYALIHAPLGYRTTNVLDVGCSIPVWYEEGGEEAFYVALEQVRRIPGVERVGLAVNLPAAAGNNISAWYNDRWMSAYWATMDSTAFHIMGFDVLRDNRTAYPGGCFLNRSAYEAMGLPADADYVEMRQEYGGQVYLKRVPLRGMIEDVRHRNVLSEAEPYFIEVYDDYARYDDSFCDLVVEVSGDPIAVYRSVEAVVADCFGPEAGAEISFLDQNVQNTFVQQIRLNRLLILFSLVALLVSLLGLVAMSVFYMRQRLKEVAVRKVFGADNGQVFWHLVKPFMACVGIGILLGLPLAWYLTDLWISGFSYRISGIGWLMALVAAFCLLVSFAAVGIQGRIASLTNPAENIKTE